MKIEFHEIDFRDVPKYLTSNKPLDPAMDKALMQEWIDRMTDLSINFPDSDARTYLRDYLETPLYLYKGVPVFMWSAWLEMSALYGTDTNLVPNLHFPPDELASVFEAMAIKLGDEVTIGSSYPTMGDKYGMELDLHIYDPPFSIERYTSKARNELRRAHEAQKDFELRSTVPPDILEDQFLYWTNNDGDAPFMLMVWSWALTVNKQMGTPLISTWKDNKWYSCGSLSTMGPFYQFNAFGQHSERRTNYSGLYVLSELVKLATDRPTMLSCPAFGWRNDHFGDYKKHLATRKIPTHSVYSTTEEGEGMVPPLFISSTTKWL